MSIIKIIGIIPLLLGASILLPAQPNYLIERYTTDNGLPSNGIKGLQWDETTGFLWIATEAGMTRYNGTDFVTFSRLNTPDLSSERMLFLLKSLDGRIFSADEAGDLFFIAQNRPQFMGKVKIDTRPSTFRLTGLIASGKLFRQSSWRQPIDFGFNFATEALIPLSEDRIVLTHNDSLYDYRSGHREPIFITTLEPGSKVFYLGGQLFEYNNKKDFYRLDPASGQKTLVESPFPPIAPEANVKGIGKLFWDNGMKNPILICGARAWLLDYREGKLVARLICSDIPTNALLYYLKYNETNETLFLGTNSMGIIVIRKNLVRPIRRALAFPEIPSAAYSQVVLPGAAILTSQGDVLGAKAAPAPTLPVTRSPALPVHRIPTLPVTRIPFNNFILTTPDSVLWYSNEDSIFSYTYRTNRTVGIPAGTGSITDGFALSGGLMYIANAVGIGIVHDNRIDYQYRYPQADINNQVPFSMIEISPGMLAIANCNGLFRYNVRNHSVDTLMQIPGICIRALWKYKGYLFIGTHGRGIYLYRNGTIKPVPLDQNGYLQYAHCFISDTLGFCWISTNKGLFRTRPEEMTAAFDSAGKPVYYQYYGRKDGMDITELNGGCTPCAVRLNDTVLSFPSMDGLVWVDPTRPVSRLPEGRIYIDRFIADGKDKEVNSNALLGANLPANTRELTFSLGYPAWADEENLDIRYRLEPYARNWEKMEIWPNPKLHFSNLPSGHYRLFLRKPNGFGQDNYSQTEFSFFIEPHWYQQIWTWVLGLCLFTALVIAIVRWRTRQFKIRQDRLELQIAEKTRELQAKNEELEKTDTIKTRLISIISHDLITPLHFLHITGKNLIEKRHGLTEELQQEAISEIATTSRELELLSTNILNWIKYRNEDRRLAKESFNPHELVSRLFGIFNVMVRPKRIGLINDVDPDLDVFQLVEPVKIVLYNLILNGINFTSEGFIRISNSVGRDGVSFLIEDTGVGMTQDQINNILADHFIISSANVDNRKGNGLGYLIIKDLMKILRGSLSIQSEKDKGSRVTVWIPLQ
jgi:signal transduction histidine kinase